MNFESLSDKELGDRCLSGCNRSFYELVQRYETKVFNTALYLTNNVEEAERVLNLVFVELLNKLRSDNGKTPIFDWLLKFTLDTAVQNLISNNENRRQLPQSIVINEPYQQHVMRFRERNETLHTALRLATDTLPERERIVFVLRDILGISTAKTSELIESNVFEVRATLQKARMAVHSELGVLLADVLDADSVDLELRERLV